MTRSGGATSLPGSRLLAVVMVLLALAATALVSAAATHHTSAAGARSHHFGSATHHFAGATRHAPVRLGSAAETPSSSVGALSLAESAGGGVRPVDHEHQRGAEWTPTLGQRLRPATTSSAVVSWAGTVTSGPSAVQPRILALSSGDNLARLGILRV